MEFLGRLEFSWAQEFPQAKSCENDKPSFSVPEHGTAEEKIFAEFNGPDKNQK